MLTNLYTIAKKDLFDLLGRLAGGSRVLVPYLKGDKLYFDDFDPAKEDAIELGGIRQSQPIKSFINPTREKIMGGNSQKRKPLILAGVKACDLSSLFLQDSVFLGGDVEDPFYAENRKNTTIIASDCTYAKETCFCINMEGAPYPRKFFDLSIAAIDNYFLVEVGSEKGQSIIIILSHSLKNRPPIFPLYGNPVVIRYPGRSRDLSTRDPRPVPLKSEVRLRKIITLRNFGRIWRLHVWSAVLAI